MDIIAKYKNAENKLILLDYDGTLVNFSIQPENAKPSVRLLNALYKFSRKPWVRIVIITGREYRSIDKLIGHLPIDIVAEHGAMIKENGMWKERIKNTIRWKHEFLPMLNQFTLECEGSFIEEKRFSIAWHYRNVNTMGGYIFSRELIREVRNKIHSRDLKLIDGNKAVEIMISETGKGKITEDLIKQSNHDYILSIGDDVTDEDMFEALKENEDAITIKVGYGKTSAKYRLDDVSSVISLLEQLT